MLSQLWDCITCLKHTHLSQARPFWISHSRAGRLNQSNAFLMNSLFTKDNSEFDLIYQVALKLFSSEGERRGCYYFTIWKRRYLNSPGQIYTHWFMKIQVAISQHHGKSQRADRSLWNGLCNVPVFSGDTHAVWTHVTFIYGRKHFLQSLSDIEKTTISCLSFCIKKRKLLTIVFGRRPTTFGGNQTGKSHANWGDAEWTLNPLFTQNGKTIPLLCI